MRIDLRSDTVTVPTPVRHVYDAADFNGDGRTDVLLQQWSMLSILRGGFAPASSAQVAIMSPK